MTRPHAAAAASPVAALVVVSAALLAVAAIATAVVAIYSLKHAIAHVANGDDNGAAHWSAICFAAGAPYILGYSAWRALALSRRALAGELPAIRVRPLLPPLAVALAAVAFQGLLAAGSYFTGDDWQHLTVARQDGLNLGYLDQAVFVHYAPGHRFAYWALERIAPLDWPLALAAMLVLFAGCILLLHLICVQLFGERRSNLVVLVLFGTSVALVPSFLWFADGLHKLPSTFLTLLAIHAYLRHRVDRSPATLALSVAAMSLGLLFYAKVLLVPLYLVLLRLLFLERRPERWWRTLWSERWTWLAFVPTIAIYLWNYQLNYAALAGRKPPPELLAHYLGSVWFRVVVPGLAGLQPGLDPSTPALVGAIAAQAILVVLIVISARRKQSAWRAWMFALVVFIANDALVGLGRLESYGFQRTTADLRYQTEMSWLLPLALAFAFHPVGPIRLRWRPMAALGCYLIAAVASGTIVAGHWIATKTNPPKAYVRALQGDVRQRVQVLGYERPPFVVAGREGPWGDPRVLIPTLAPQVQFVLASSAPRAIRADGHLRVAHVQPFTGPAAHRIDVAGTVQAVSGTVTRRRHRPCLAAGSRPGGFRFAGRPPPFGPDMYARIGFVVAHGSREPALVTTSASAIRPTSFRLDRRAGSVVAELGDPLRVRIPSHAEVCLRSLAVGWLHTPPLH